MRIKGIYDSGENSTVHEFGDVGIFFNQSDVKSADHVTYDNNGNVIPLSKRFTGSPDILYSEGGEQTEADQDLASGKNFSYNNNVHSE